MLFASELAAFVGRNRYEDPASAAAKVWRRTSPATYLAAESRVNIVLRTAEDVVQEMGVGLAAALHAEDECGADAQVDAILQQSLLSKCSPALARDVADVVLGPAGNKVERVVRAVEKAAGGPLTAAAAQNIQRQATDLVGRAMSTMAATAPEAEIQVADQVDEHLKQQLQVKMQEQVREQVREQVQVQVQVLAQSVKVKDRADAATSVKEVVNKGRGTAREPEALELFEQQTGASVRDRNDRFYMANLGTQANPCWLGGRVDGVCGDRVVEVKCRRNRFFRFLPEYEKVQIHAYMHLTGKRQCELVQKYNGQIRSEVHHFDPEFWAVVRADACTHWALLLRVFDDEGLQDELLRSCVA
jgi:hypothetical protein